MKNPQQRTWFVLAAKAIAGILAIRLIDPIEVFYIVDRNTVVPIISKSGCSSVKLALIQEYEPSFKSKFPDIHQTDPSQVTGGKIERKFFYRFSKYSKFVEGKNLSLIIRDPKARIVSCYNDVLSEKNIMYLDPSGLSRWVSFTKNLSFDQFIKKISNIPDYLSDRHFRSQAYFIENGIDSKLSSLSVYELKKFFDESDLVLSARSKHEILNKTESNEEKIETNGISSNPTFSNRYENDLKLFKKISEKPQ